MCPAEPDMVLHSHEGKQRVRRTCLQNFRLLLIWAKFYTVNDDKGQFVSELFNYSIMQVKMWITASDITNCTITVVTENLDCDVNNLLVYTGHNDVMMSGSINDRAHFHGNHKLLTPESSVTNDNGQKECVFRCEDMCHYVFISVEKVPDESSWKICEVLFK